MIWALSRSARDTGCLMGQGLTAHFTMLCTTYCSTDLNSALSSHCLLLALACSGFGLERGLIKELGGSCLGTWSKSDSFSQLKMTVRDFKAPMRRYETLTALSSRAKASTLEVWDMWGGWGRQVTSWFWDCDENVSVSAFCSLRLFLSSSVSQLTSADMSSSWMGCFSHSFVFSSEYFLLEAVWAPSHPCSSSSPIK